MRCSIRYTLDSVAPALPQQFQLIQPMGGVLKGVAVNCTECRVFNVTNEVSVSNPWFVELAVAAPDKERFVRFAPFAGGRTAGKTPAGRVPDNCDAGRVPLSLPAVIA